MPKLHVERIQIITEKSLEIAVRGQGGPTDCKGVQPVRRPR